MVLIQQLRSHKNDTAKAQCIIDEEIAAHEAAIRRLKSRRNTYSTIARLPPETLTAVFLSLKTAASQNEAARVAWVCRQWRDVALASPRLWSFIDTARGEYALELLARSKSAPLRVTCLTTPSTERPEPIFEAIMKEVGHIQKLTICLPLSDILHFLRLNGAASAPMLQFLQVISTDEQPTTPLPPDILLREMPSLLHLGLSDIEIRSDLPPFPHLTYLTISVPSFPMTSSQLLHILRHSPKLERIVVYGVAANGFLDASISPIQLPNLSQIDILSYDLEVSAILANAEYPPSASVAFINQTLHAGEPDLTSLAKICRHLHQGKGARPSINNIELVGDIFGGFRLTVLDKNNVHLLSVRLEVERRYSPASSLVLCMALGLETLSCLTLQSFEHQTETGWSSLLSHCTEVQDLRLTDVYTPLIKALMGSSSNEPPLPKLQTLRVHQSTFVTRRLDGDASFFVAFKEFLEKRKHLDIPVKAVKISTSIITAELVEELRGLTEITWDGDEGFVVYDDE
ncbi:hypothetical protein AB1N83_012937 [Pleurotus pulmonarius]|nr:hypothetical protein EYR36_006954 [Pleurotus pulmonarius]